MKLEVPCGWGCAEPDGPACRRLQDLILRFVRFCGGQPGCLVGSTCPARAHLLLAPLKIVAQVLCQPLPLRLGLFRMRPALCRPVFMIVALHGHPLPQNRGLRKRQAGSDGSETGEKRKAVSALFRAATACNGRASVSRTSWSRHLPGAARPKTSKCGLRSPSSYGNRPLACCGSSRRAAGCCYSSGVEHSLGKGEAESSNLSSSTSFLQLTQWLNCRNSVAYAPRKRATARNKERNARVSRAQSVQHVPICSHSRRAYGGWAPSKLSGFRLQLAFQGRVANSSMRYVRHTPLLNRREA